jgi:hypothetical protein
MTTINLTAAAHDAALVVGRFARGEYRITEKLNVSPQMYASLRKAGIVDAQNRITEAGRDYADNYPTPTHNHFTANA